MKVQTAKLLSDLCEHVADLYPFMMNFSLDAISRCLQCQERAKNSQKAIAQSDTYPENLFDDPELCAVLRNFRLNFESIVEFMEVCIVAVVVSSWLLPTHTAVSAHLDQMLLKNLPGLLLDKDQNVLIRQRTSLLVEFTNDTLFQTLTPEQREQGLD